MALECPVFLSPTAQAMERKGSWAEVLGSVKREVTILVLFTAQTLATFRVE
jgi:hypothetical protein